MCKRRISSLWLVSIFKRAEKTGWIITWLVDVSNVRNPTELWKVLVQEHFIHARSGGRFWSRCCSLCLIGKQHPRLELCSLPAMLKHAHVIWGFFALWLPKATIPLPPAKISLWDQKLSINFEFQRSSPHLWRWSCWMRWPSTQCRLHIFFIGDPYFHIGNWLALHTVEWCLCNSRINTKSGM